MYAGVRCPVPKLGQMSKHLKNFCVIFSVCDTPNDTVAVTRGAQIPGDYVLFKVGTNMCVLPVQNFLHVTRLTPRILTLSLLMSYIYGAPCEARNFNVVYIWTYVWQR
jgi:hypothetical protein